MVQFTRTELFLFLDFDKKGVDGNKANRSVIKVSLDNNLFSEKETRKILSSAAKKQGLELTLPDSELYPSDVKIGASALLGFSSRYGLDTNLVLDTAEKRYNLTTLLKTNLASFIGVGIGSFIGSTIGEVIGPSEIYSAIPVYSLLMTGFMDVIEAIGYKGNLKEAIRNDIGTLLGATAGKTLAIALYAQYRGM